MPPNVRVTLAVRGCSGVFVCFCACVVGHAAKRPRHMCVFVCNREYSCAFVYVVGDAAERPRRVGC